MNIPDNPNEYSLIIDNIPSSHSDDLSLRIPSQNNFIHQDPIPPPYKENDDTQLLPPPYRD